MLTYSELEEVSGSVGNFKVKIRKKARYVDDDKCTGCGICIEKCPRKVVDDEFEAGMGYRKAIYTPFPQAVPRIPVIDTANCIWFTTRQVPGLREGLPHQRHRLRAAGRDRRARGGQHHHGHRLEAVRLQADAAVRLRAAGQRLHQHGVRAAVQRGRPDQRQDRAPRRQDRAQVGGHHPLRGQPRRRTTTSTARTSAAWRP